MLISWTEYVGGKRLTPGCMGAMSVSASTTFGSEPTHLAGNTSGDDHDLDTLESLVELVGGVAVDLRERVV